MDGKVHPNIRRTCRTCLRVLGSRKELVSIFDVDQTLPSKSVKFSEMLSSFSSHPVYEHDDLPKRVCIICLQQIRGAFFFKSQAENAYNVLARQLKQPMPVASIKREDSAMKRLLTTNTERSELPLILAPRTITNGHDETFNDDDMLVEIEAPKIQEPTFNYLDDSDDQEIIDYEPDFSDDEPVAMNKTDDEIPQATTSGHSPDSGIIDDSCKISSTENIALFTEQQMAESQLQELKQFVCNICTKQMISFKALQRHKRNHHCENRCAYCKKRFTNRVQLKLHTRYRHPDKYNEFRLNGQVNPIVQVEPISSIPECGTCGSKFCEREALYRHHSECDKMCIECGIRIYRKDYYFIHLEKEHGIKIAHQSLLECPFNCPGNFTSEKILQDHIQNSHPEEKDQESVADTFSDDGENSVSNDARLFCCVHCPMRFSSQRSLTQHNSHKHKHPTSDVVKTRNVPKYSRDEFIDKFMVRKSYDYQRCLPCKRDIHRRSLGLHLRGKHASSHSFICEICNEGFFRIDYRQRHMTHVHFNQLRCNECEVQFDRAYKYDAHMAQHSVTPKNFKPEEGLDRYDLSWTTMKYIEDTATFDYEAENKQRSQARRPSVLSTSVAQVEIPLTKDEFCEKYLISLSDKFTHCTICQQKMMKGSIISHVLWKHALKKPLKCAFCNERVVKNTGRLSHMGRCHPNEYRCQGCNVQFTKHDAFATHMMDIHGEKVTSKPSSGEEDDLSLGEVRFVSHKNDEEVIEEPEVIDIEPYVKIERARLGGEKAADSFPCQFCSRSFSGPKNLQIHKSHKHKDAMIEAASLQVFESATDPMTFEEFRYNYVEGVSDADIKCLVCEKILKKKNFGNHIKSRHATTGAYKCAICSEAFFRPEHRIQHMSSIHRGMFFCQTCNIQFYRNSRYAKHMKDMHDIDVDNSDNYEVDLCLGDLKFVPLIKRTQEEEMNALQPSIVHEPDPDPEEMDEEYLESSETMTRDEFMTRYMKNISKDLRRCIACDKNVLKGSMYNHLMRFHAITLPYKCPFCDLRLERSQYRMRHLQMFHPDDYKCNECGLQFDQHGKFTEHMLVEHNIAANSPKAPGEEKDLSSYDIKYIAQRAGDDNYWQDDDSSEQMAAPEMIPAKYASSSSRQNYDKLLKPKIKEEPNDDESSLVMEHSIFGTDDSLLEEQSPPQHKIPSNVKQYNYNDFKNKFVIEIDAVNLKCIPCDRIIVKTSACAHLRLWHAITMCYNCELCPVGFQRTDYRQRHMKFTHPEDFLCNICNIQFYRSVTYRNHMLGTHKVVAKVQPKKTKNQIDVPLEDMKFIEHVPDSVRLREHDGEPPRKGGRPSNTVKDPINPQAGGLTYQQFVDKYISANGDGLACSVCRLTMTKFSVKKHMKRCHATSKPFYCELCPEGFQRPDVRMQHMATIHSDNLRCFQCNIQFYISTNYADHMQQIHNMSIRVLASKAKCDVDVPIERLRFIPKKLDNDDFHVVPAAHTVISPDKMIIKKSKNSFDDIPDDIELTREQFYGKFFRAIKGLGEPKTKCLACHKIFSSKNRKFHALHNHATFRPLKCEICPSKFFLTTKRVMHMGLRHPNDYKCSECNIQFDRAHYYASHMLNHHKMSVVIPNHDQNEINVPSHFMRYTKKITAVRTLRKQEKMGLASVDLSIDNDSESSSFMLMPQEPLKCVECGEEFDSSRSLRIHMRNHSNSAGYKTVVENLARARELKALEYVHQCEFCEKKFSALFALNAHKKFKHNSESPTPTATRKHKLDKPKYEVDCDICEFKSHRRDYVEHHVKALHRTEFQCRHCFRICSNYNMYMYHLSENHPKGKENLRLLLKCDQCDKAFKLPESLTTHKEKKHETVVNKPEHYCYTCGVGYTELYGLEIHNGNHVHKSLQNFIDRKSAVALGVKNEPTDNDTMLIGTLPFPESDDTVSELDPFQRMMEYKLRSTDGPPSKRSRFSPTSRFAGSRNSILRLPPNEEDKLEYLQYLQFDDGVYKCGICGKVKNVRKHMLHHLKQHKEVPTYSCDRCPEKFVFKKKYEQHMEIHENQPDTSLQREEMNIDEHPKYQETAKKNSNEIVCSICDTTFKLTIMLNRHNSTWHADDNPDKDMSMIEQKAKKEVPAIKLLRCKHCLQAFIIPSELKEHLKVQHNSESIEDGEPEEEEAGQSDTSKNGTFPCDKCRFVFKEKKFLENHTKFFCMHRQSKSDGDGAQVINEQ